MAKSIQKFMPCLWFTTQAEEAAQFYTSVFNDSRIDNVVRAGETGPGKPGAVITVMFYLENQIFMALNGNSKSGFSDAISLVVHCDTQEEIDGLWAKLTEGGSEVQCGWLKDKFGVSWQIVPANIGELLGGDDPAKTDRVMQAVMKMVKLDKAAMEAAASGT